MEEHKSSSFVCVCAGVPPPRMEWFKDAVPLSRLANPRYKVSSAAGLTVRRAQPEDGGIFQCVARNAAGEVQAYTHLLVSSESSHTHTGIKHIDSISDFCSQVMFFFFWFPLFD